MKKIRILSLAMVCSMLFCTPIMAAEITTTEDAVIIYSCNKVDIPYDLESHKLRKYHGITIETQQLPDIVNTKEIDKIIITPDKPYDSRTTFKFSLEKGK